MNRTLIWQLIGATLVTIALFVIISHAAVTVLDSLIASLETAPAAAAPTAPAASVTAGSRCNGLIVTGCNVYVSQAQKTQQPKPATSDTIAGEQKRTWLLASGILIVILLLAFIATSNNPF